MPLSNEDSLRLNVLMAQQVKAIRIDEGKMLLYALTSRGEAKIVLNPNVKNERYLKLVKDFLSNKVLDVAGGFPAYISRWNRMGEARGEKLDKLLLLGEPEAVIAVVNSRELNADMAASAWWAFQSADSARSMLANESLVNTDIGVELAKFLLEFLPFEEEPSNMLESIRLVLQPGLISEQEKYALWKKAKTKNTLYLGFLDTIPNQIPEPIAEHSDYAFLTKKLEPLLLKNNPYAVKLCELCHSSGQTFLRTAELTFKRPPNQTVYVALIESIRKYVYCAQTEGDESQIQLSLGTGNTNLDEKNIASIVAYAATLGDISNSNQKKSPALQDFLETAPELKNALQAIIVLSRTSQAVTIPVFSQSSAVGTLMRKKLKPVTDGIVSNLRILQNFSIS